MAPPTTTPDFSSYDVVLVNTSAGKDSEAMLAYIHDLRDLHDFGQAQILAVHCDLGRAEWAGTPELAKAQCDVFDTPIFYVQREGTLRKATKNLPEAILGDLPAQILERHISNMERLAAGEIEEERSPWPSTNARWCTSDQKTSQVGKLITQLAKDFAHADGSPVRILNCLGLRADESTARAKKRPFHVESSNGVRHVDRWLPIFDWTEAEVWATIKSHDLPYHEAYDYGMERLSCVFCPLAKVQDLVIAAKHNPVLAQEYLAIEELTGHAIKEPAKGAPISMADIIAAAAAA